MHTFDKDSLPNELVSTTYQKRLKYKKRYNPIGKRLVSLLQQVTGKHKRVLYGTAIALCCAFIIFGAIMFISAGASDYGISVDGQIVAVLSTEEEAMDAVNTYFDEKSELRGVEVSCRQKVDVDLADSKDYDYTPVTIEEAVDILNHTLDEIVEAWVINVNGVEAAALISERDAKIAVEYTKKHYLKEGEKILDAKIREEITYSTDWRDPEVLLLPEVAANQLLFGVPQLLTHDVESNDETLWTIAKQYDVPIEQLKEANPGLTSDALAPEVEVKIASADPIINVIVVKEVITTAEIPFSVDKKNNSDLLRGTEKTISEGERGLEEVTLKVVESNGMETNRERMASTVLVAPVNKVVERGTKIVVASRGSGSAGTISWPVSGRRITSRFGARGSGYHTGVDIDGKTGDPAAAVESGKVIFAAYSGNYGNLIKIDHGDGFQTWYAHLSKIGVSVGQQIEQGQYIGAVGSTGRSTGAHMHLEVRINGTAYNPLNYLK